MSKQKRFYNNGFTIVELLIVIVVIAILSTLVIVGYNGVARNSRVAAIKADLSSFAKKIESYKVTEGQYPTSLSDANITVKDGVISQYVADTDGYCLSFKQDDQSFKITNLSGTVIDGRCANGGVTTIFAGTSMGMSDGTGTAAQFTYPYGVVAAADGTIYVTANGENRIRKITPDGVVSTLAGFPVGGTTDGTGTAARFNSPAGMAINSSGDIYLADMGNNRIRKITPSAVVTTFAGSGAAGAADGTGTSAEFNSPSSLAFDSNGNLFVADGYNFRIRKITPAGVVTTLAGSSVGYADGTGAAAQFRLLQGIAVLGDNSLLVTDSGNRRIRKVTQGGVVTTFAGSGVSGDLSGTGTAAQFRQPYGIAVTDDGTIYVSDIDDGICLIRKITLAAVVTTFAGGVCGTANGTGTGAQFDFITALTIDTSGNIYAIDNGTHRVRKIQ